eukprot:224995_1
MIKYDDEFIMNTMQKTFDFIHEQHAKHFDHKHKWMMFYSNCRTFDPSYKNKPSTCDIATQHIPWGYDAYKKYPKIQKLLDKDYEKYVRNTKNINESPRNLKLWWTVNQREYRALSKIVLRCLNQPRGGCDVERSFNHFSRYNRNGVAASMAPNNKELRDSCHWNKESLAEQMFGVKL